MRQSRVVVRLSDEFLALLDERVAKSGQSRSDLIRHAIERELHDDREAAIDRAIVEGYTRIPQEPDPLAEVLGRRAIADEPW